MTGRERQVSRLFETLEKIRERETGLAAAGETRTPPQTGRRGRLIALWIVAAILAAAAVAVNLGRYRHSPHILAESTVTGAAAPATGTSSPAGRKPALSGRAAELNAEGCRLLAEKKYWQAVILFDAAARKAKQAPEPLINTGVALAELGLFAPAAEKFRQAKKLAPEHPALKKNLAILEKHGLGIDRLPLRIRVVKGRN